MLGVNTKENVCLSQLVKVIVNAVVTELITRHKIKDSG